MEALKLAGKVALSARLVVDANAKNLSDRIKNLETDLDAYDNKIISLDKYDDLKIDNVFFHTSGMQIQWSSKKIGFGELTIHNGGIIKIDSECMGEEFCNEIFRLFVKEHLYLK